MDNVSEDSTGSPFQDPSDGEKKGDRETGGETRQEAGNHFQNVARNFPYDAYFNGYNVHTVFRASNESGADDPSRSIVRDTAILEVRRILTEHLAEVNRTETKSGKNRAVSFDQPKVESNGGRLIPLFKDD